MTENKNILIIRNDSLEFLGFVELKEKIIISFLSTSVAFYPWCEGKEILPNQIMLCISQDRIVKDSLVPAMILNHLKKEIGNDGNVMLKFFNNKGRYVYIPGF